MTKDAFKALKNDVRHLAIDIGLRPAARAMGINEDRVRKWASLERWQIGLIHPPISAKDPSRSPGFTNAIEAKQRILRMHSDRTKLGFALAATTVSEHLADKNGGQLCAPATAISADQWSRVADRTHGWSAERAQGAQINVAVVAMPGESDRAQREAMHARLDDIARQLGAT